MVQTLLFVLRVGSPSQVEIFHQPLHLEIFSSKLLFDQLQAPASDRRIGFHGRGRTSRRESFLKSLPEEGYQIRRLHTKLNYRQERVQNSTLPKIYLE